MKYKKFLAFIYNILLSVFSIKLFFIKKKLTKKKYVLVFFSIFPITIPNPKIAQILTNKDIKRMIIKHATV